MSIPVNDIKKIKLGKYKLRSDVYHAILQASNKYNVPLNYMLAIAAKESNFDPNAKATTSSATGLYQFINATWKEMWKDYKIQPPPTDPYASADAGARYVKIICNKLKTEDPALLYLGHFLGPRDAYDFFEVYKKNPDELISIVANDRQLKANKTIFYNANGSLKTVKDIYNWSDTSIKKIIERIEA